MYTIASTWKTPAGTPVTTFTETVGANVIWWSVKTALVGTGGLHGFMYVHGSGGTADYFHTRPQFAATKNELLDLGGVVMECTGSELSAFGGANNWARPFSRTAYSNAAQLVAGYLGITDWLLLLRSMGALVGLWLATQDPYLKPRTVGVIHMSGIFSMLDEFDGATGAAGTVPANHFDLPSWWGTPEGDRAALATATADADPRRFPPAVYDGLNIAVIAGGADTTALYEITAGLLWSLFSSRFGPKSRLSKIAGATHDVSPGTFDSPVVMQFVRDVWNIPSIPEPKRGWKLDGPFSAVAGTPGFIAAANSDGTLEITPTAGATAVNNGDGILTLTGPVVDNGDGTFTITTA
jgi:pimeloyl-ACP methyl ester carboxylesterase